VAWNSAGGRTAGLALAAGASSAGLAFMGTGLAPQPWATWLAPLPVLLIAPRLSGAAAFALAALAWLLRGLNETAYLGGIFAPGGPPLAVKLLTFGLILAGPAVIFGAVVILWRRLVRRGAPVRAAFAAAAAWAGSEFLVSLVSPHGSFGSLGYSQAGVLPVIQLAALTGIWGVSFCLMLAPAAAAAVFWSRGRVGKPWALAAAVAILLASVLGFGIWRLAQPADGQRVKVGLIASDLPANLFPAPPGPDATQTLAAYEDQAKVLAAEGAQIVVLPEKLVVVADRDLAEFDPPVQAIADSGGVAVLVGVIHFSAAVPSNEARLYLPHSPVLAYAKQHLLPPFESAMRPGSALVELSRPSGL
jgi:apolipoprotein N-acyltransferase